MGFEDWESIYARHELKPIDKFKNKSNLLKQFGPNGVRVYNAMDGFKTASQICSLLSLEQSEFSQIMDFILQGNMASAQEASSGIGANAINRPSPPQMPPQDLSQSPHLSPMEQSIYSQYGEQGMKVYALIDGHKSAREILEQTGISESKLVEILEFMNRRGIIKLEKPQGQQNAQGRQGAPGSPQSQIRQSPQGQQLGQNTAPSPYQQRMGSISDAPNPDWQTQRGRQEREQSQGGFSPMVENEPAPKMPLERQDGDDLVAVDIPIFPHLSIIDKARIKAILALKFGQVGTSLTPKIDGVKDFVQLSIETELSLHDLDIILGELGRSKLLQFRQLDRNELRHRYGDDGLAVYKKFGRDGLLVYQLIGKANTIKDIIKKSQIEQERAIDIIMFVHSMLGLDMPLDRDMIYRYINAKK
ncbi:MAG: hypothetical protein V1822_01555 [Candidatus Micrarchaeota archaeon]